MPCLRRKKVCKEFSSIRYFIRLSSVAYYKRLDNKGAKAPVIPLKIKIKQPYSTSLSLSSFSLIHSLPPSFSLFSLFPSPSLFLSFFSISVSLSFLSLTLSLTLSLSFSLSPFLSHSLSPSLSLFFSISLSLSLSFSLSLSLSLSMTGLREKEMHQLPRQCKKCGCAQAESVGTLNQKVWASSKRSSFSQSACVIIILMGQDLSLGQFYGINF